MAKRLKTEIMFIKEESETVDIKEEYRAEEGIKEECADEEDPLKVDFYKEAKGDNIITIKQCIENLIYRLALWY